MKNLLKFILRFLVIIPLSVNAQHDILQTEISIAQKEYSLSELLNELIKDEDFSLSYSENMLNETQKVQITKVNYTLNEVLDLIQNHFKVEYSVIENSIVIHPKIEKQKHTISGIVSDSLTGEALPYATVINNVTGKGTLTNKYGYYALTLSAKQQLITVTYLGYKTKQIKISQQYHEAYNIELAPQNRAIEEVTINAHTKLDMLEKQLSSIDLKNIKKIPNLGEADILQSIKTLPGVASVAEVGRGFNVRGGGVDQNLILIDEALVYNSSHLEGFYSVFNADIVKDVKFYKGDIPASYGGRLSSVIDITQKEGNMKSFHGSGGIGPITCKLAFEGPIIKDKMSFIVSARRSFVHLFFPMLPDKFSVELNGVNIHFYDVNTKVNYRINDNNRIYISSYIGKDYFKIENYNENYGNITTTIRYNHIFTNRLFSNTSLIYSDYNMYDESTVENELWNNKIGIDHYEFKNEFSYYLPNHQLKFGVNSIYRLLYPGEYHDNNNNDYFKIVIPTQHALESALFLSDNINIKNKLDITLGLRYSMFHYLGEEDIYHYRKGIPRDIQTITDTTKYAKNAIIAFYHYLEPRVNLKFNIGTNQLLKLSYGKTAQYTHLITNTVMPLQYDMWKPSNNNIAPQTAHQVTFGYFGLLTRYNISFAAEAFYKTLTNTLEVKPGADIVLNRALDADLMEGTGKAYGIEFQIKKNTGRHTGSLAYTYSRSLRKIDKIYSIYHVNTSDYYPTDYDVPHNLNINYNFQINERNTITTSFTYLKGRPATFPNGEYTYFEMLMPYYAGKNTYRLPDFHRLDISYALDSKKNENRSWQGQWLFSLYNVYARRNAYQIYIRRQTNSKNTQAFQLSILGSIVPVISYSFNF